MPNHKKIIDRLLHLSWLLTDFLEIKKQLTVSRSSVEAEYRSVASTVCELQWIFYILQDFQLKILLPIPFKCDNQDALHIAANSVFHECAKHIDISCHIVRNKLTTGFISTSHISSKP